MKRIAKILKRLNKLHQDIIYIAYDPDDGTWALIYPDGNHNYSNYRHEFSTDSETYKLLEELEKICTE